MATSTTTIKNCKENSYIVVDDEACRVVSMVKSKPGKHGAAKVRLEAIGLFDEKKRVVMKPADSSADVPIIEKRKAQVISISGIIAQLMDLETYETFETTIPAEFRQRLTPGTEGAEVLYWKYNKNILIKEVREGQ